MHGSNTNSAAALSLDRPTQASLSVAAMTRHIHARMRRLRWTSYTLVVIGYILAFFHRLAPAAIASDLQQSFHTSGAALGSLAAAYFYAHTVMQIPVGVMADTLGVRKVVAFGALISGLGSLLFGLSRYAGARNHGPLAGRLRCRCHVHFADEAECSMVS